MPTDRAPQPDLTTSSWSHRRLIARFVAKRSIDVVGALVLLLCAAPLVALSAVAIALHDGGPVLYRQVRIGRHGEPFTIVKLRTMVRDAEARQQSIADANTRSGPLFKAAHDPRVTPPGSFLRSACLDELPQLWNVVRGDMSLVGPRPALPGEVAAFDPHHREQRHRVRPGLTGPWQVTPDAHDDFAAYRALDLDYVAEARIGVDLRILVATVALCVRRGRATLLGETPTTSEVRSTPDIIDLQHRSTTDAGEADPVGHGTPALARTGTGG